MCLTFNRPGQTPTAAVMAAIVALRKVGLATRMANFELPPWRSAAEITGADGRDMIDALRAGSPDHEVLLAEQDGSARILFAEAVVRMGAAAAMMRDLPLLGVSRSSSSSRSCSEHSA